MPAITTISRGADPSPVPIKCERCGCLSPFPICPPCEMPHARTAGRAASSVAAQSLMRERERKEQN